jgi:DNA-binding transcriptional LysR family regulator
MMYIRVMDNGDLDLPALRCLTALVAERSVTRTAEKLGMSQPAVSRVLARLRRHFADALLVRAADGMVPTARALEIAAGARDIVAAVERLARPQRAFEPRTERSTFVVTVPEYFERVLAPALIGRVRREAPNVSVELRAPNLDLARDWLDKGEIDFRLAWIHRPRPESRFGKLPEDRLVCLVRKGHPTVGEELLVGDFYELPHVRPSIAVTRDGASMEVTIEQYLGLPFRKRPVARRLHLSLLVQSFSTIRQVVAETDMIATVPERATWDLDPRLGLRVMRPPIALPPLRGALYWHERNNADSRHQWFRRVILRTAQEIARPTDPGRLMAVAR